MPQNLGHRSQTLKSAMSLIESPDTPIIVAGGPSSSELLNDLRDRLIDDVVELDRRTREAQQQIALAQTVFNTQVSALSTAIQALTARLPSATGQWLADFFTTDLVHAINTAEISTTYGQATLPILSSQEKLVGIDTRGDVWIPKGARVSYSYKGTTPQETDWLPDDNGTYALDQRSDTAWWRSRETSGTVWVRVQVPVSLNASKLANCVILHPYPVLTYDLVSVEYRNPAGVWTSADLSYLEGWDGTKVAWCGNLRLLIPPSQVTELRIKLTAQSAWGFSKLSLRQLEFSPTATLVTDFTSYGPTALTTAHVLGKDQDSLSYLTTAITGLRVSVALTQNSANSTPVVTGIEVR